MPSHAIKITHMGQHTISAALAHDESMQKTLHFGDFLEAMFGADPILQTAIEGELRADRVQENDAELGRMIRDRFKAYRWNLACDKAMKDFEPKL